MGCDMSSLLTLKPKTALKAELPERWSTREGWSIRAPGPPSVTLPSSNTVREKPSSTKTTAS
jgi:hypothetical protein